MRGLLLLLAAIAAPAYYMLVMHSPAPTAPPYRIDMAELRTLGRELAEELVQVLGRDHVQAYGKVAIVGVNGELEHGAVWHEAGGWAMRAVLGDWYHQGSVLRVDADGMALEALPLG